MSSTTKSSNRMRPMLSFGTKGDSPASRTSLRHPHLHGCPTDPAQYAASVKAILSDT